MIQDSEEEEGLKLNSVGPRKESAEALKGEVKEVSNGERTGLGVAATQGTEEGPVREEGVIRGEVVIQEGRGERGVDGGKEKETEALYAVGRRRGRLLSPPADHLE